jgi:hypothetical protein
MNRTGKIFSIAVVLFLFTFYSGGAFAAESTLPTLNRTTTGFTIVLPESNKMVEVLVTFKQDGTLLKVERCISDISLSDKKCGRLEKLKLMDQKLLYSCVPLKEGERPQGTLAQLPNYESKKNEPYDCQYVTATEPGEPVIFKTGDNTSCPMVIAGMACDPCKF